MLKLTEWKNMILVVRNSEEEEKEKEEGFIQQHNTADGSFCKVSYKCSLLCSPVIAWLAAVLR